MKVSFVIPSYNSVEWLPHAVESCLNQTYKNIEIIIVNDGSTDETKQYLDWLLKNDKHVTVVNQKNSGRGAARNAGNRAATGDVLCVMDADDYSHPSRAEKTVERINAGNEYVYGSADIMDALGRKLYTVAADVFNIEKAEKELTNRIIHSSVGYTKRLAELFPYSEMRKVSDYGVDDWLHGLTVARSGARMDFITIPIVAYRSLDESVSGKRPELEVLDFKRKLLEGHSLAAAA